MLPRLYVKKVSIVDPVLTELLVDPRPWWSFLVWVTRIKLPYMGGVGDVLHGAYKLES